MASDKLIQDLVDDLKPVKRQMSPRVLAFWMSGFMLVVAAGFISFSGLRPDLFAVVRKPSFAVLLLFALAQIVFGIRGLGYLTNPGRSYIWRTIPWWTAFLAGGMVLAETLSLDHDHWAAGLDSSGLHCAQYTLLVSVSGFAGLFYILRKRVVLNGALTGALIGVASVASGWLAISLVCGVENPVHILLYHLLLPGVIAVAVGAVVGRRVAL